MLYMYVPDQEKRIKMICDQFNPLSSYFWTIIVT